MKGTIDKNLPITGDSRLHSYCSRGASILDPHIGCWNYDRICGRMRVEATMMRRLVAKEQRRIGRMAAVYRSTRRPSRSSERVTGVKSIAL